MFSEQADIGLSTPDLLSSLILLISGAIFKLIYLWKDYRHEISDVQRRFLLNIKNISVEYIEIVLFVSVRIFYGR